MRLLQADSAMTAAPLTTTSDLTLIAHIREPAGSSNMELAGKKQEGVGAAGGREGVDMDRGLGAGLGGAREDDKQGKDVDDETAIARVRRYIEQGETNAHAQQLLDKESMFVNEKSNILVLGLMGSGKINTRQLSCRLQNAPCFRGRARETQLASGCCVCGR